MKRIHIRRAGLVGVFALLLLPLSCAKSPPGASTAGPQLIITMTVAGSINPQFFYFVLFNNANDSTGSNGPVPVISIPWGNGFATGRTSPGGLTQYVRYDPSQPQGGFGVYAVNPASLLDQPGYLGVPVQESVTNNTLQFQIPLSDLATAAVPTGSINYIQINFLATNSIPVDPNYTGTKYFDALGDSSSVGSINDYITISTTKNGIYQNSDKNLEPGGDVAEAGNGVYRTVNEPDLDITNWSVEVRD